jgi:hypothetical protein
MATKPNNLSKDVVRVMESLSKNEGLARLLAHNVENPFDLSLPPVDKTTIANPKNASCKIFPFPFDPNANVEDTSFIRVYYNQGEFNDNEVIQEMNLHIDIIVAKSLWLINNGREPLIRPYEIMDRVIDLVGKKSVNSSIKVKFSGWQHLAVNQKFDAIRLYSDYFDVDTNFHTYDSE